MKNLSAPKLYALAFGFFLGVCILKFGNPVILDRVIDTPASLEEFWRYAWPLWWANLLLTVFFLVGVTMFGFVRPVWSLSNWLWLLPLIWLAWQFVSATQTVDGHLTAVTLWQFVGCVCCYFLGAKLFASRSIQLWVFVGIFAGFALCLVRAVDQRLVEFPLNYQMLVEGQQCGWTNFPPEMVAAMKQEGAIVNTNGMDLASPQMLAKFDKARVMGTLVYPNALAGLILLLLPVLLATVVITSRKLKSSIRILAIALVVFLGMSAFYWSGSKLGWLIALGAVVLIFLKSRQTRMVKWISVASILLIGLVIFAVRFHQYFESGAHSANARLDYWRAAARTAMDHPIMGTGPGTFQRAYAKIKRPESEMARLAHNDYLEQFSDSGFAGGLVYAFWIFFTLWLIWRKYWRSNDWVRIGMFIGLLAWFIHGIGEFGLFIPGSAWLAFTLLGSAIGANIMKSTVEPAFGSINP